MLNDDVVVVIGIRGFGLSCARRLGVGKRLLIADNNADVLQRLTTELVDDGYDVTAMQADVSDRSSVLALADRLSGLGRFATLVHTAGVSPGMANWERIFEVNLIGTIHVLDAFRPLAVAGTVAIVMGSNAAYFAPVPLEIERKLAVAPINELKAVVQEVTGHDTGLGSYWLAKRSNQLRVQAQASEWGAQGARILSVSPGIISTPMIRHERLQGAPVDETVAGQPIPRLGTSEDIAAAVYWLAGPEATYITGTDLLIDGGMQAALRWSNLATEDLLSFKGSTAS